MRKGIGRFITEVFTGLRSCPAVYPYSPGDLRDGYIPLARSTVLFFTWHNQVT